MKIEKIQSKQDLKEEAFGQDWYDKEYANCFVDLSEKVSRPEALISIGEYSYKGKQYPTPVMTAGEFSCISAPSKSKKSFLKSQFVASYIGGQSTNHFDNIKGHRDRDYSIIDCDTEQSKFYAHNTFQRVQKITGQPYKNYFPFKLRHLSPDERVAFIDNVLKRQDFEEPVKIVFIDGIADLVEDSNDLVMSNYIAGKLMQWTDKYNIHVCIVIHNAYGTVKPTGHLGSAVVKKAESVILLTPEDEEKEVIQVSHLYSRGRSFDPFYFQVNSFDSLPYKCGPMGETSAKDITLPQANDIQWDDHDKKEVPF